MTVTEVKRFPCNTEIECAWVRFVREAIILGARYHVFVGSDRSDFVIAVRNADVELCAAWALGVLCDLLIRSEAEQAEGDDRWVTIGYERLLWLGRSAGVVPMLVVAEREVA
jgi:hypothetical protein